MTAERAPAVHAAECGVWDVPELNRVEVLLAEGWGDEATARYLSEVSPIYNVLNRVMGQLSGILLLAATTRERGLALDHAMYRTACDQLAEGTARLAAIRAPAAATRHRAGLEALAGHLAEAARAMEGVSATLGPEARQAHVRDIVRRLQAAQRLVIATARPDANITPVDLRNACCSCGATGRGGAGPTR